MMKNKKIKRIFHTWDKWECYPSGFYENQKEDMTKDECKEAYRVFLSDLPRFEAALKRVITEWKHSCEHYLSNENMNRIAWLGKASLCIETGIPSTFRSGYFLLTEEQQKLADQMALKYLNEWLRNNNYPETDASGAGTNVKANIY